MKHVDDQARPNVYKYLLLPQSSVTVGKFFSVRGAIRCYPASGPMISSSYFDFSELFSVLTRTEHTMNMKSASAWLAIDVCLSVPLRASLTRRQSLRPV